MDDAAPPLTTTIPAGVPPFEVLVSQDADVCRIEVRGELDLITAPTLDLTLTKVRLTGIAATVIVDLRWLITSCTAGIGLLMTHHYALRRAGSRLVVMYPPHQFLELIAYNRLDGILDIRGSAGPLTMPGTGSDIPAAV